MVLYQKIVDFPCQTGHTLLPQGKELKYLGVLFMDEGKMMCETRHPDWYDGDILLNFWGENESLA